MKLVVINSTGPMGSTVVSAIVEKFGYLNLPIRDLGMHEYLMGKREINDDFMKRNVIHVLHTDNKKIKGGGTSIPDRDTSPAYQRINLHTIQEKLHNFQDKKYANLIELYRDYRGLYCDALKYKNSNHKEEKHIELTTDFHKFPVDQLCNAYLKEFGEVIFIHLHRDFLGWVESIASQRFSSPPKRLNFFLHELYRRYEDYEKSIKDCPGIHLNFESLFVPHNKALFDTIAMGIDEKDPGLQWTEEQYDLYGNIRSYERTFTLADVKGSYLSFMTLGLIRFSIRKKKITLFHDAIVYFSYLIDLGRFHFKKKFFKK